MSNSRFSERSNFRRTHTSLTPYETPKTFLKKCTDALKDFFVPSWFVDFLESQPTGENFAQEEDESSLFCSLDGVWFQNSQIVTPGAILSDSGRAHPHPSRTEHVLPSHEGQGNPDPSEPRSSINPNPSMDNDVLSASYRKYRLIGKRNYLYLSEAEVDQLCNQLHSENDTTATTSMQFYVFPAELHQSEDLSNIEEMRSRRDSLLEYFMDPSSDPMSAMAIYDHFSGICNNRQSPQESARLVSNRERPKTPDAQRIPFNRDFTGTILQFKVPSSRPTSKEAIYDYFTTFSMTRKSTKKKREKKFKIAYRKKMCVKKPRRRVDIMARSTPGQAAQLETNSNLLEMHREESVQLETNSNLPEMSNEESVQFETNFNLPEMSNEESVQFETNFNLPEMSNEESVQLETNFNLTEIPNEESVQLEANSNLPEMSNEESVQLEANSNLPEMPNEESVQIETNSNLPEMPNEESVQLETNSNLPEMPNEESVQLEANFNLPEMPNEESVQLEANSNLPEMPNEESVQLEANFNLPEMPNEESVQIETNSNLPEMPREESVQIETNSNLPEIPREESDKLETNSILPEMPREESVQIETHSILPEILNPSQMQYSEPSQQTPSLIPSSSSNRTYTEVPTLATESPNLLTFPITTTPPVSSQSASTSSDFKFSYPVEVKSSIETPQQTLQSSPVSEVYRTKCPSPRSESPMDWFEMSPPATSLELPPLNSSSTSASSTSVGTTPPDYFIFGQCTNTPPVSSQSPSTSSSFTFRPPAKVRFSPATPQQTFPSTSAEQHPTPQCSSLPTETPMDCSDMAPQATTLTSSAFNSTNSTSSVLPSTISTPPSPFNIFGQSTSNFPAISPSPFSSAPFQSSFPAEWNLSPATPQQTFPSTSAAQHPTPQCTSLSTETPMDCSDMAAQTTSFTSSAFNSSNTMSSVLPSATQTHSGPFNIFSQNTNNFPVISPSRFSSSTFQSGMTPSTAPMKWPTTDQPSNTCKRPFLKVQRKTSTLPKPADPIPPAHFIFGQSTNTPTVFSQSASTSSPFQSSGPAVWNFSPTTQQNTFTSSSVVQHPTPQGSSFSTESPMDSSEMAPQTTNQPFNSSSFTSTVLPSANPTPPPPFNIFDQRRNTLPVLSQNPTSNSTFQSTSLSSTAPMKWPTTDQPSNTCKRPFLKVQRKTSTLPKPADTTPPAHFIFGQSTNTPTVFSQSASTSSPFQSSGPAVWNFSPTTQQNTFPSSSVAQHPTPQGSSFPTESPMDSSEMAPQTTSPPFNSSSFTSTVLPSTNPIPPPPFNIFDQRRNTLPVSSQNPTSSSIFQSTSLPSTGPMDSSEMAPQTTNPPFNSSSFTPTVLPSAIPTPPPLGNIFDQRRNNRPVLSQNPTSSSIFQSTSLPSTGPMESSEMAAQTTNQPFNSSRITSTVLPSAIPTPPPPFNIFDQRRNTLPVSSQNPTSNSAFQSTSLPSTAPMEPFETPRPTKLWTRPFLRSSRKTSKLSRSADTIPPDPSTSSTSQSTTAPIESHETRRPTKSWTRPILKSKKKPFKLPKSATTTGPGHYMFDQSTNIPSSSFKSRSPAKVRFSPTTQQHTLPSLSEEQHPTPECSSVPTETPPVSPSNRDPFEASEQSRDVPRQAKSTTLPKKGSKQQPDATKSRRCRRSGADH